MNIKVAALTVSEKSSNMLLKALGFFFALVLLSSYLCFISFLYLYLYIHGDEAFIHANQTSELRVRLVALNV